MLNFMHSNSKESKMKKLIISCFLLVLASSVYATDPHVAMKGYQVDVKKLQNKADRAISSCKKKSACVDKKYNTFVKKREKLIKSTFRINIRSFNKFAKKTLKSEASCVKETPSKAKACFKKYNGQIHTVLGSLN